MTNRRPAALRGARARHATRASVLLAAALAVAAPISLGAPGTSAAAAPARHVLADDALSTLPAAAHVVGSAASSTGLSIEVTLAVRNPALLQAMLAGTTDRRSPWYHHYLAKGQFARLFGATGTELARVVSWLRTVGVTPTGVSGNRLAIRARTTVGRAADAFRTSFAAVRDGRRLDLVNRTAPSVPSRLAGAVQGVIGLDTLPAVHADLVRPATRTGRAAARATEPIACSSLKTAAQYQGSFTAAGLASYYSMASLYRLGDNGQNVHVALAEFEPNWRSDVTWFEGCYKASNATNYVHVDGGSGAAGPGSGESALDIENVISLAPRATIDIYQAPNTDMGAEDMYAQMATSDTDKVISTSWGSCEPDTDTAVLNAEAVTFAQVNLQGQVVFAAAGDSGSSDCFGDGVTSDPAQLAVDDPGSQSYVLSVGGTTAAAHGEVVWDSSSSGGGGGISSVHCMPAYQDNVGVPNLINANSTPDLTSCPSGYYRQVPDVTGMADPNTGYTIYYDSGLTAIGGTSGSAPLWAATAALVLASPYCAADHATVGVSPQSLYALAATPQYAHGLRDITSGHNAVSESGYSGSLYPAAHGYDEASGLGSPLPTAASGLFVPGLASLLCHANGSADPTPVVTRVVPSNAASNTPTTLTVLGTGFLPIGGAVRVDLDGRSFPATCATSTRCTVKIDNLTPRTSDLQVLDQTYATSPVSSADKVTVLAAPTVTRLSPSSGSPKGKTRVTVTGTGFTGKVTVHFGTATATQLDVVSSTKLVVTAPAGTGSVYVRVNAAGGISARSPAGLYHY